jgi:quercetin dioxygenase-like cupin family protein
LTRASAPARRGHRPVRHAWATLALGAAALGCSPAAPAGTVLPRGAVESAPAASAPVAAKRILDNERMTMYEYVFPAGFRGDEHAAVADEFAYVLEGEFTVETRGQGMRVLRPGEVEYARRGTWHRSLNQAGTPARVLVVLLKEP